MEDSQIVKLFLDRDETAISQCESKYGSYCRSIACRILGNDLDAQECVNDTYQAAWNSIPPHRPAILSTYLGKLTRRISLKVLRGKEAQKRGNGETDISLEELTECISAGNTVDSQLEFRELVKQLNEFLGKLPADERRVFIRRYWHALPISEICAQFGYSKSKVESMLHRTRKKLRDYLNKEGYSV